MPTRRLTRCLSRPAAAGLKLSLLALAAVAAAGCDEDFASPAHIRPEGQQVVVVSGNNQSAAVGSPLPQPLRVQVRDSRSRPAPQQRVDFSMLIGDALLSSRAGLTDFAGFTQVRVVPLTPGDLMVKAAQAGAGPEAGVSFNAFAIDSSHVRNPAAFEIVGGDGQTGPVGSILPQPLTVRVLNADANPLENFPVLFTATTDGTLLVTANEGDFTQIDSTGNTPVGSDSIGRQVVSFTDGNGVAGVLLRLHTRPGNNQVTASSTFATGNSIQVVFNLTGEVGGPGSAAALNKISGDGQNVTVDTTGVGFTPSITFNPMVVQVTDRFGNPIGGVTVFFKLSTGFGTIDPATAVSEPGTGFAETTFTSSEGSFGGVEVTATVPGSGTVSFTGSIVPVGGTPEEPPPPPPPPPAPPPGSG